MNCIELAYRHARAHPVRTAIWMPGRGSGRSVSFEALFLRAGGMQRVLLARGVRPGQTVLLVDRMGPRLYASVLGALGLGCTVMLVEPWLPVARIDEAVKIARPDAFLASGPGRLWGARVAAIRRIPRWIGIERAARSTQACRIESVDASTPAILTFTSGTTGRPKGVVRSHGFLVHQHEALEQVLGSGAHPGPDLCIFANFVLANLASGRTTLLVPPAWKPRHLRQLNALPDPLQPVSLTCGSAFLLALMRTARVPGLQSIHVGGALTDCWILEEGFDRWPDAAWYHLYGSTEAEPVARADARLAVALSRARGHFQTLYLGKPVAGIRHACEEDGLWVAGPHVGPAYLGNDAANRACRRRDATGRTWHCMGDRVHDDDAGLWYRGRSDQRLEDFELEQRIYAALQSSKCFVHRTPGGERYLVGEVREAAGFPELAGVLPARINRDRRHRARIDRKKTLSKGGNKHARTIAS